jgi:putative transposase
MARLRAEEIKISWSGRKRCHDNILAERLWRTIKYEEVYLPAYRDGWEAETSLARFLWKYCHVRPQSLLAGRTRLAVYTQAEPCSSRPGITISRPDLSSQRHPPHIGLSSMPVGLGLRWFGRT